MIAAAKRCCENVHARDSVDLTVWTFALWAATIGVIVGVALEEYEFICKVFHCTLRYGPRGLWRFAKRKGWRKSAHHVGFILLVVCLAAELVFQAKVEVDSDAKLGIAQTDAATANTKAADLLAENVELEHDLAPRDINLAPLINGLKLLPRVPLFVSTINSDESKQTASGFLGLPAAFFDPGKRWAVSPLPLLPWVREGITVSFVLSSDGSAKDSENVAVTVCETLKAEGMDAQTEGVRFVDGKADTPGWTSSLPANAVVISVGAKPKRFWENKRRRALGMPEEADRSFCTLEEVIEGTRRQSELDKQDEKPTKN